MKVSVAAPLYFQNEIDSLLSMPKRILSDSWKKLKTKDKKAAGKRANEYEAVAMMRVEPFHPAPGYAFEIDIVHNQRNDDLSITLYAQIVPRLMRPICRYDLHDLPHPNPEWFAPELILAGQFHRHVYNERAIREGDVDSWCDCAEPLDFKSGGTPAAQMERLRKDFLDFLHLEFDERGDRGLFVNFPRP